MENKGWFGEDTNHGRGNVNFPTTSPTLAQITAVNAELEEAITAADSGDSLRIAERNVVEERWIKTYVELTYNIRFQAGEDEVKVQSAGFELEKPRTKAELPEVPVKVTSNTANISGGIHVTCSRSKNAITFQYAYAEATPDGNLLPNAEYKLAPVSTRSRQTINHLTRGQAYNVKVKAIGSAGASTFSNPIVVICQ